MRGKVPSGARYKTSAWPISGDAGSPAGELGPTGAACRSRIRVASAALDVQPAHIIRLRNSRTRAVLFGGVTAHWMRALRAAGGAAAGLLVMVIGLLTGIGWLYTLRGLHWLGVGPRVGDSLPLLALATFDGQPLLRVLVAWVLAGALTGVALSETTPHRRAAAALGVGLVVLLLAAQESYALTRNVTFSSTVFSHSPGVGPVLEAVAFSLGCWLPRRLDHRHWPRGRRRLLASVLGGAGDGGLRGGEGRDVDEHDRDREPVHQTRRQVSA